MFKRSLLSLVLVAGLACPAVEAAWSWPSMPSMPSLSMPEVVKNAASKLGNNASSLKTLVCNHKLATLGTLGVAALSVAGLYYYLKCCKSNSAPKA